MRFFCFLALAWLFKSSNASSESKVGMFLSTCQKHRCGYDKVLVGEYWKPFDGAHAFLEKMIVSVPEKVALLKRAFLTHMTLISKGYKKEIEIDGNYWNTFSYPTVQEALEISIGEMTAMEAVYFARDYPKYFFNASPAVLEAIKDYSAFTVADVALEIEHGFEGFLLDIESAVKTLSFEALIRALRNANFELSPRQQQLITCRIPELALAAIKDARLLYQVILPYADDKMIRGLSPKVEGKKKEAKNIEKDGEAETVISPCLHPLYGNLIKADQVLLMRSKLPASEWKMLVFSYVVYTNSLIHDIFETINEYYPNFIGHQESTFTYIHQFIIDDLKLIGRERAKLLAATSWSKDWTLLLSTPFGKRILDALAAVDGETKDILIKPGVVPFKVEQWLWAQVKSEDRKEFPFQVKSSKEIFDAFKSCFLQGEFKRFRGGHIVHVFLNQISMDATEGLTQELREYFDVNVNCYKKESKLIEQLNKAALEFLNNSENGADAGFVHFKSRQALERLIQFIVPPKVLLQVLNDSNGKGYLYDALQRFPEIIGVHNWQALIENGFCPEEFVANFTGNMIQHFNGAIVLPNLEKLTRGLFAVPFEKVVEFLRESKFLLDEPLRFAERMNSNYYETFTNEPFEESVEFFNMLTPWVHFADRLTYPYFKFAETLTAYWERSKNSEKTLEFVVKYLLRIEINFFHFRFDQNFTTYSNVSHFMAQLELEFKTRTTLAELLKGLLKKAEDKEFIKVAKVVYLSVLFGPIGPARVTTLRAWEEGINNSISTQKDLRAIWEMKASQMALSNMLLARKFQPQEPSMATNDETLKKGLALMEVAKTIFPDDEYSELLFTLATMESGLIPLKLSHGVLPSAIFKKALEGEYKCAIKDLCENFAEFLFLDLNNGEFVTQDWETFAFILEQRLLQESMN